MGLLDEMEGDSNSSLDVPNDSGLAAVANLAEKIIAQEQHVKSLEHELKGAKAKLLKMTDEDLPSAMQELNLSTFSLNDGSRIVIKPTYGARISKDNEEKAFEWLRSRNEGDLIKNTITCRFNKEQDNEASALFHDLQKRQLQPERKAEIHSATLRSWAKGRIEEGKEIDMELFGVWVGQRAEIKRG